MSAQRNRRSTPSARAAATTPAAPSWMLMALEARATFEWASLVLAWPWLKRAPVGDGHPVLVLPGLVAGDASTWPLRRFLEQLGYAAQPWELGLNMGPRGATVPKLMAKIAALQREHGQRVSLIGWSLGGAMARALASEVPEAVRTVITLGSPIQPYPKATNAWRLFEAVSGWSSDDPELHELATRSPPMPNTSILSKADGIVSWKVSLAPDEPHSENIEIPATHLGMGANPIALWAIADRLAQPEGAWRPFDNDGPLRSLLFRKPAADITSRS